MYSKGDWIVHAYYGVGQVMGTDKKVLDGEPSTFIRVKTSIGEYWLPIEHWDVAHIRPISSLYQIKRALSILRTRAEPLSADHKQRRVLILEAASNISIYTKARTLRDLYGRKLTGKLNVTEAETLARLKNQIINEWSVLSGLEKDSLVLKLDKSLQIGFEKLKEGDDRSMLEKVRKGVKEDRAEIQVEDS
jgi:RNA polymerase-interacting CarD/CdnL/TRCF family regulator